MWIIVILTHLLMNYMWLCDKKIDARWTTLMYILDITKSAPWSIAIATSIYCFVMEWRGKYQHFCKAIQCIFYALDAQIPYENKNY